MKSEKLSTEIAALQRKQKETKNAVAKKALSSKIERLKKELDEITTSAQAKTALAKAQSKIREMSQKDFGEFVKKLAAKPEFSFLKGMSKGKIKDDIMRVAKPVGWRFRGRTNVKKPTKKDIQEGNNVYYEGRVNRSDVSRTVRLAEGGGVGVPKKPKYKIGQLVYSYQNKDTKYPINYIKEADDLGIIRYRLSLPNGNSNWINEESIYGEKYANGGGVGKDRYNLSFNYNPSIVKNEYAEGIVSKYTNDWKHDNDWDEVTFYVEGLTKQQASELRSELKMEDVYNIEIEKGRYTYSKGGGVGDISESVAKQSLMNLKESGEISQLTLGNHGQVFMSIKGGQVKSYDNYKDAYAHYHKTKYAKGGKTDFGMLSVKAGIDNNPNPTYADKIAGAKMNKMAKGGEVLYLQSDGVSQRLVNDKSKATTMWIMDAEYYLSSQPQSNASIEKIDKSLPDRVGKNYIVKVEKYAKGGGVGATKDLSQIKKYQVYIYYGGEQEDKVLTTYSLETAKKLAKQGEHAEIIDTTTGEMVEFKYANGGGVGEREKSIKNILKGKKYPLTPKELKDLSNKSGYSQGDIEYVFQKINNDLQYKVEYANGGGVGGKKINYDAYDNKSIDYVEGEIVHTERSARAFRNEGNLAEAEDRENHAKKLWEIYYKKRKEAKYATGGGVGLVNYGDYSPTVSYKIPDEELSNFIDYVYDVYKEQGYTKMQVKNAVNRYLSDLDKQYTWGYGDSLDRERVYEYLLNPKLKGIQNPSLAKGGDVQSSEPHRLHMMAKGGMTFSESVLKEGLSDMLHHLYKAQNELDGIMGYLDRTGQGGMKSALKSKFGLNSISETTEKIDTYLDK